MIKKLINWLKSILGGNKFSGGNVYGSGGNWNDSHRPVSK